MDLNGAVGNGGLRQRICHALAKQGAHIAVVYAQSRDQAEAVARELTSTYQINAAAFACDITDAAAVQNLVGDVTNRFRRSARLQDFAIAHGPRRPPELVRSLVHGWTQRR
jgi:3-oxoacyl-[acyl-carrier protein] reductase